VRKDGGTVSDNFDIIAWEDALAIAYAPSPPILLLIRSLHNSDDVAFVETQVSRLRSFELELGSGLTRQSLFLTGSKRRLRRCRPGWSWTFAI
jgi:hypothetical protein